jgi:hypothetical protein
MVYREVLDQRRSCVIPIAARRKINNGSFVLRIQPAPSAEQGDSNKVAKDIMPCKSCHSHNQSLFPSEICIHFPGLKDLTTPHIMLFPQLVVCLDCGFVEFSMPEPELHRLIEDSADDIAA